MPVLAALEDEFRDTRPLSGRTILLHLHLTRETAALGRVFVAGGATVRYWPSNKQPARAALVDEIRGHGEIIDEPGASADDRGVLVVEGSGRVFRAVHGPEPPRWAQRVAAISMHTSGGGTSVDAHRAEFRVPVVAVYRDALKADVETRFGTGQSVAAALLAGLDRPIAGLQIAIVGFGRVGRGVARTLRALGGRITVVDVDAEARLGAQLDGFRVQPLAVALASAHLCCTASGRPHAVDIAALERARSGVILANISDKRDEIDVRGAVLESQRAAAATWKTPGGVRFELLGGGVQVNHVLANGNPAELMDLSFGLHAQVIRWLAAEARPPGVHAVERSLREPVIARWMAARS